MSCLYISCIYDICYCIEAWGFASKCQINALLVLQKKIIRIMTFSPYLAHIDPIFKDLSILQFDKIFIDKIGIRVLKVKHELLPIIQ